MREWVYDCWNHIMDAEVNPLRHIPDLQVRHMIMQILAFMWSSVFAIAIAEDKFCRKLSYFEDKDAVGKYRLYYKYDKPFATWKQNKPKWI